MAALLLACFNSKYRELYCAQANEQQDDKIAGGLQGLDDVGFRFDSAIGVFSPVREHRFKSEWHFSFHDESDKCLYARLREELPARVVIAQLLSPLWELTRGRARGGENGGGNAIGINEWDLQLRREPLIP